MIFFQKSIFLKQDIKIVKGNSDMCNYRKITNLGIMKNSTKIIKY